MDPLHVRMSWRTVWLKGDALSILLIQWEQIQQLIGTLDRNNHEVKNRGIETSFKLEISGIILHFVLAD